MLLIGCAGASCSGKSTLTEWLSELLSVPIVHQDKHYKTDHEVPVVNGIQHWDCPQALDMDSFVEALDHVKRGLLSQSQLGDNRPTISKKDLSEDELNKLKQQCEELHKLLKGPTPPSSVALSVDAKPANTDGETLTLVDGFLLLDDPRVFSRIDLVIFLHADYDTLLERRNARSGYVTLEGFWQDPPNYFKEFVWPAYVEFNARILQSVDPSVKHQIISAQQNDGLPDKQVLAINSQKMSIYEVVSTALSFISNAIKKDLS
ncbi:ribosylnicotinamide kinase [Blyttiomyces sp. JEL0837]|nr:ribosylnicotinamide kinase [Blyttiomyces sp. JEL0837]